MSQNSKFSLHVLNSRLLIYLPDVSKIMLKALLCIFLLKKKVETLKIVAFFIYIG